MLNIPWNDGGVAGEHQPQEKAGLRSAYYPISNEEPLKVWELGNDLAEA